MSDNNITDYLQSSSSAAAPSKTYSAKELGEMANLHPAELLHVDMGLCTNWYTNDDFIEEMMSYVVDEKRMDELIKFILLKQEQQICKHHPKVCYRVPDERKYVPYVMDLSTKLDAMRVRVLHEREVNAKLKEMESMWLTTSTEMSSTENVELATNVVTDAPSDSSETNPPVFSDSSSEELPYYHISDLPYDVEHQILINDDKVYTEFVLTLKGPVKNWIEKHRLQDWNVVRFICRLRGVVASKCSTSIFGKFLEKIGLGNQEANMKKRKDANDTNALLAYDNPLKWEINIIFYEETARRLRTYWMKLLTL